MSSRSTASKQGKPGKRKQRFTQRDIERAKRAAPDCTIIVRPDGTLELRPPAAAAAHEGNEWDGVK